MPVLPTTLHPPKFNREFTPEKWWLEDDPFLLGEGNFSGGELLNFGRVVRTCQCAPPNWYPLPTEKSLEILVRQRFFLGTSHLETSLTSWRLDSCLVQGNPLNSVDRLNLKQLLLEMVIITWIHSTLRFSLVVSRKSQFHFVWSWIEVMHSSCFTTSHFIATLRTPRDAKPLATRTWANLRIWKEHALEDWRLPPPAAQHYKLQIHLDLMADLPSSWTLANNDNLNAEVWDGRCLLSADKLSKHWGVLSLQKLALCSVFQAFWFIGRWFPQHLWFWPVGGACCPSWVYV